MGKHIPQGVGAVPGGAWHTARRGLYADAGGDDAVDPHQCRAVCHIGRNGRGDRGGRRAVRRGGAGRCQAQGTRRRA